MGAVFLLVVLFLLGPLFLAGVDFFAEAFLAAAFLAGALLFLALAPELFFAAEELPFFAALDVLF